MDKKLNETLEKSMVAPEELDDALMEEVSGGIRRVKDNKINPSKFANLKGEKSKKPVDVF